MELFVQSKATVHQSINVGFKVVEPIQENSHETRSLLRMYQRIVHHQALTTNHWLWFVVMRPLAIVQSVMKAVGFLFIPIKFPIVIGKHMYTFYIHLIYVSYTYDIQKMYCPNVTYHIYIYILYTEKILIVWFRLVMFNVGTGLSANEDSRVPVVKTSAGRPGGFPWGGQITTATALCMAFFLFFLGGELP